jgi:O-antigen/teichoic acid export membrane protein
LLISAFINVGGNLILIQQFSIYGAVTARLLSTFALFFLGFIYVKRRYVHINWPPIFLKPIIATTVMVICLRYFSFGQNILIDIIMGILIYFLLLLLFGEISFKVIKDSSKEWLNKKHLLSFRKPSAKG